MSPKPDVSEERKHQILDAAMKVFARLGLNKARMDDIVDEAGMSKGGLYWYFKSKDEIIYSVLDRMINRELDDFYKNKDKLNTAEEKLYFLVDLIEKDMNVSQIFSPIMYDIYAFGLRNNSVRKLISISLQRYFDLLIPIIQEGIKNGEFRSCDPQEAAIALGGMIEGTILLKAYQPETVDLSKHIRTGVNFFIQGIKAEV
ncbi:MAG: hypothetical protein CL609_25415 [Anaerolineaceae bacterium]|nr:hypothetical protein [Anaerolineaceae bacterium]